MNAFGSTPEGHAHWTSRLLLAPFDLDPRGAPADAEELDAEEQEERARKRQLLEGHQERVRGRG